MAKAVRRFWPIVLLLLVLGIVVGQLIQPQSVPRYESTALLLIAPTSDAGGSAEGDRYVASQLVVLESPPLAARATEFAEVGMTEQEIAAVVNFAQIPGTDVVRIVASSGTPQDSQAISNAYLDAYLERTGSTDGGATESGQLAESIERINGRLDEVAAQIEAVMAPFVQGAATSPDALIPTVEQIAPALATEREVLLDTYTQLLSRQTAIEFGPEQPSGRQAIQRAELPTSPTVESSRALSVAIVAAMTLLGVVAATVLARISRRVLDGKEVSDSLGVPFAATIPPERVLRTRALFKVQSLPEEYRAVVNELCVQVESQGTLDDVLTVLVSGTQRVSGSTTLATAIAARFGELGSRVLLVDLDFDQPDVSKCFGVQADALGLLANAKVTNDKDGQWLEEVLTATPLTNVAVAGRRPGAGSSRPQRAELLAALEAAGRFADVVVLDGGPILNSPAASVMAPHADVIVLAVPVRRQERASLQVVSRQLLPLTAHLLPVSTPRLRRSSRLPVQEFQPPSDSSLAADVISASGR